MRVACTAMDRTTVYIPLFPAAGPTDPRPARLLALGFEGCDRPGQGARGDPGGLLGRLLGQVRGLLARSPPGAEGDPASPRGRGDTGRGRRVLALEPIPDLTEVAGAGLGLALGLALTGGPAGGRRLLAFGRLETVADPLAVAPLADPGPLLDLLERLGPQPQPLTCLLPAPKVPRPGDGPRWAALARANLHCRWVDSLPAAIRACAGEPGAVPRTPARPAR